MLIDQPRLSRALAFKTRKMSVISKTKANSESIFRHLCDQMDRLSGRQISVEEAKAQANLAKQANNTLRYELDRAKFIEKYGAENLRNIEDEQADSK